MNIGSEQFKTSVAKNSIEASFDEWMEWLVEEPTGHLLEINLYDQDHASSDEFLGYAGLDVMDMVQVQHQYNTVNKAKSAPNNQMTTAPR